MLSLKEEAKKQTIIKLEDEQDKKEFLEWYIEEGGVADDGRHNINELNREYIGLGLFFCAIYWSMLDYIPNSYITWKKLKGEKEMTKSDLKDGMVVELRNGDKRLVLFESFIENSNWDRFCEYTENLINNSHERRDVVKIYTTIGRLFNNIFEDRNLTLIWERKEKSEAEIKLDTIEKQIEKLQKSAKELREVINNG